jgi:hypothetical protein
VGEAELGHLLLCLSASQVRGFGQIQYSWSHECWERPDREDLIEHEKRKATFVTCNHAALSRVDNNNEIGS